MSLTKSFTQGGQVTLHHFRMIQQVGKVTILASLGAGFFFFCGLVLNGDSHNNSMAMSYYWAEIKTSLPFLKTDRIYQTLQVSPRERRTVRSVDILVNPYIIGQKEVFERGLMKKAMGAGLASVVTFIICCLFWIFQGRAKKEKEVLEGTQEVEAKTLKALITSKGQASFFQLAGVPLLKNSELQHILVVGTTGSGKTNCFHDLLRQVRQKNQRAVIVDLTGVFVQKYYEPGRDRILNPLDARSEKWTLWSECQENYEFNALASALIPTYEKDPFWTTSSQIILSVCAQKLKEEDTLSLKELIDLTTVRPLADIQDFFQGTKAASLLDVRSKETASSIRATLSTALKALDLLQDTNTPFSIKDWIKNDAEDGWLFLSSPPAMRETLRPLLSAWMSVASKAMMSLQPSFERRVWFVIDELPALNKLPDLQVGLAEYRKYGGCFVLGTQDLSLLDEIYGHNLVRSIANLCSTKVIFRIAGADVADRLSKWLGSQHISESVENISYGAHQMRDGVSLNDHRREKAVITPDKLMKLANLEGYLKLPGDYPVAKITFQYHDLQNRAPSLVRIGR